VNADADWTFWHSYSSLPINFESSALPDSNAPKNWNDVVAGRFGAEYRVTDPLALRVGFAYDPSPCLRRRWAGAPGRGPSELHGRRGGTRSDR